MKRIFLFILFFACPFVFSKTPAYAQNDGAKTLLIKPIASSPKYAKRALVIGIDGYETAARLNVCAQDAKNFAALLAGPEFGFPPEAITLFTDAPGTPENRQPTYTRLLTAIRNWQESLSDDSEVIFFFSGHGTRDPRTNEDYLIPRDGDPRLFATCISYDALRREVQTKKPRRALMIVDACRDLNEGAKSSGKGSGFGSGATALPDPELAELRSCRPTELSREGLPQDFTGSVFTHFLIKGLKGDREARSADGKTVTFDSLRRYVRGNVSQYVQQRFASPQNPDGLASFGGMVLADAPENNALTAGAERLWERDGAVMVYVPGGTYHMGAPAYDGPDDEAAFKTLTALFDDAFFSAQWRDSTLSKTPVWIDGFWMDKTEVTVAQYRRFCQATGRAMPEAPPGGFQENHPIVNVSWNDAQAYAQWAGKRLPTEAEWEKAARGTDQRWFPWGSSYGSTRLNDANGARNALSPVGTFPGGASPYGCLDMAGNAAEWCADWYDAYLYIKENERNPVTDEPDRSKGRVLRGGSWGSAPFDCLTFARGGLLPEGTLPNVGFRCASSL